jgi:hypothetical protein
MILATLLLAWSQPQPLVRVGTCPLGYYSQGNYCVPSPGGLTRPAIERDGASCPLGYYRSANYCVKS